MILGGGEEVGFLKPPSATANEGFAMNIRTIVRLRGVCKTGRLCQ